MRALTAKLIFGQLKIINKFFDRTPDYTIIKPNSKFLKLIIL